MILSTRRFISEVKCHRNACETRLYFNVLLIFIEEETDAEVNHFLPKSTTHSYILAQT